MTDPVDRLLQWEREQYQNWIKVDGLIAKVKSTIVAFEFGAIPATEVGEVLEAAGKEISGFFRKEG